MCATINICYEILSLQRDMTYIVKNCVDTSHSHWNLMTHGEKYFRYYSKKPSLLLHISSVKTIGLLCTIKCYGYYIILIFK